MKFKLTEKEEMSFRRIARDRGFMEFIDKWILSLNDLSTIEDLETLRVRKEVIRELEENLIYRLNVLSGKVEPSNPEEFI